MWVCTEDSSNRGEEESERATGTVSADPGDGRPDRRVIPGTDHLAEAEPGGETDSTDSGLGNWRWVRYDITEIDATDHRVQNWRRVL